MPSPAATEVAEPYTPAADQRDARGARDATPAVQVLGLTKQFAAPRSWRDTLRHPWKRDFVTSVHDVRFDVAQGEFFGLLGPNGAGKTTLFKLLSAAVLPDSGTAVVAGHDVIRSPQQVRRALTPVLASDRTLNWRLSARENLRLYASLFGLSGRAAERRIEEVLELVRLADVGEKMLGTFSSGMAQRLSLARAFLTRPSILLLDEPTRSLDPVSARDLRQFLREEVCLRQGCTVLLATHSADEALSGLCDRVAVMNKGEVLAVGTAHRLQLEFGDERYRLWTTTPEHHAFASLAQDGLALSVERSTEVEGEWYRVDVIVPGSYNEAARVLAALAAAGVSVARFERVELSLADLIERVVTAKGNTQHRMSANR
jgi:ABC-2 type transport system ATP-binding protein